MSEIVGMGIDGTNNLVLTWFDDSKVIGGSSKDLSSKRKPATYKLAPGKTPADIVGVGVDGSNNLVFAWYRDGTVSAGSSRDLDSKRKAEKYQLPAGKTPADVIDMGIDGSNNLVVAWFRDGTVSAGSSRDLDSKRKLEKFKLPPGKTPADIVGIAVDGFVLGDVEKHLSKTIGEALDGNALSSAKAALDAGKSFFGGRGSLCFAWYRDGTVSAGRSTDLSEVRLPASFTR